MWKTALGALALSALVTSPALAAERSVRIGVGGLTCPSCPFIVSSALKMMQEIMAERYPTNEWNIYAAQASDGDNWNDDSPVCRDILINQIMPFVQYFSYVEITPREHQALWYEYNQVAEAFNDSFAQQQLVTAGDIYPVFRELFQRRMAS